MLKKRIVIAVLLLATTLFSFNLSANQIKLAVIDMDHIFQNYYKTKIADAHLKQQAEVYRAWIQRLNDSLLKLEEEFKILRDSSQNIALSSAEREKQRLDAQKKYREIRQKRAELEQYTTEKTSQYKKLETGKRRKILEEIQAEVARRATLHGYTLVLDKSGKTLNDIPSIIYHNPALDITESVLVHLNRGNQSPETQK